MLDQRPAGADAIDGLAIAASAGAFAHGLDMTQPCKGLTRANGDQPAIARIDDGIMAAVKHDGRHRAQQSGTGIAALHRENRRSLVPRRAQRQPGMRANRSKELGIGVRQHQRHRGPGGQARDIDPGRIGTMHLDDPAGQAGDDGRLAMAAQGILRVGPVPAPAGMALTRLARVKHDHAALLGQQVHPGAGGKILGRLPAAMQHDQQRPRPFRAGRLEQTIAEAALGAVMRSGAEAGPCATDRGHKCHRGRCGLHRFGGSRGLCWLRRRGESLHPLRCQLRQPQRKAHPREPRGWQLGHLAPPCAAFAGNDHLGPVFGVMARANRTRIAQDQLAHNITDRNKATSRIGTEATRCAT